ncbi:MAG: 4Fe-4S dicluster domain-containing protein, partial [Proteobacteria bacterium]|nr:4Fe-4S dicluster domain-containing protein [Pseudomonadota bacterium]
ISGSLAKKFRPMGKILNHYRADGSLYVMHYLLSFLMLASLPFSRLFHMVLIPFASSVSHTNTENFQKNIAFIHTATLYACTNCGYCSQVCSVFPNFQITGNHDILPHSKIESVKAMINNPFALNLNRLKSGNAECTFCRKCTDICPSNIDLQGVWAFLDEQLVAMGYIDNYHFVKNASPGFWTKKENETLSFQKVLTTNLADKIDAFENCVQCTICTNVCPVVEYDSNHNDMTPQQIMNLLRLGKKHLATGTRMVWNCLTCYSCQEHCPEQIKVADILLELRNNGNLMADRINLNPSIDKGT